MKVQLKSVCLLLAWLIWSLPLHAETVTLNLKDADISALISTVAAVTDKNFIVDPRVKGKVTVISSRPMNSDEVYQVFLSILKVHGFAAVPSGEVIKIVPDVNAKQDGIPTASDGQPGRGDEMVTRVVQVDNVAAAQLVPILRPLIPQQGHLAAYPATNVLIISDRARNVERLVSIIRRIDQVSDSEIEIIPLQHASATEVVRVLTSLNRAAPAKGKVPGVAAGGQVLVADERTNSVLLGGDRATRLRMRAIISHLDTPLESGGNTDVVYLRYAVAADIVGTLMGVGKVEEQEEILVRVRWMNRFRKVRIHTIALLRGEVPRFGGRNSPGAQGRFRSVSGPRYYDEDEAARLVEVTTGRAKLAILMARTGLELDPAEARLDAHGGVLSAALGEE